MAKVRKAEDVVVWKFALYGNANERIRVSMPRVGAKVLSAAVQGEDVVVYAEVLPSQRAATRVFWLVETGKPAPPGATFLGTVMLMGGAYVLHAYDLGWA